MTKAQTMLYFREWAAVRRACKAAAAPEPARHELHLRALGVEKSSKVFTNADFDRVLAEFRAISQPANVTGQVRQLRQPRARLEMSMEEILRCIGVYVGDVEAYAGSICLERFGTPDWRDLSAEKHPQRSNPKIHSSQLDQFQWTLSRCLNGENGLRNRAGDTLHEMKMKAEVECHCATFCRGAATAAAVPEPEMEGQPF